MALTERTRDYETLIRHHENGTIGAHHQQINEVLRDGVVINATILAPQPIEGAGLTAVLGAATEDALVQVEQQAATILSQSETIAAQAVRIAELEAQVAASSAQAPEEPPTA